MDVLISYLTKTFKPCLSWGYLLYVWQEVRVISLHKVGRVADLRPKSYRPIKLSSFLLKTLERLIDRYIRDVILDKQQFDNMHTNQEITDSVLDDLNKYLFEMATWV